MCQNKTCLLLWLIDCYPSIETWVLSHIAGHEHNFRESNISNDKEKSANCLSIYVFFTCIFISHIIRACWRAIGAVMPRLWRRLLWIIFLLFISKILVENRILPKKNMQIRMFFPRVGNRFLPQQPKHNQISSFPRRLFRYICAVLRRINCLPPWTGPAYNINWRWNVNTCSNQRQGVNGNFFEYFSEWIQFRSGVVFALNFHPEKSPK